MKIRLDKLMVERRITETRSQAENYIKLKKVTVNKKIVQKPGHFVDEEADIKLDMTNKFVSRAGFKLASVARDLSLDFRDKVVLDVGSSTGGFTDFALQNGAKKVVAVDVGTDQMHLSLRSDPRIELHEKTDIRGFKTEKNIDIVVIDVSFISLREILPSVAGFLAQDTIVVAMVKPQFEAGRGQTYKGVVKNNSDRRKIMQDFEFWSKNNGFVILNKRDSEVRGAKGNQERFYLMKEVK